MTYRQHIQQLKQEAKSRLLMKTKEDLESDHLASLSDLECYNEGYTKGRDDAADHYTGAFDSLETVSLTYPYSEMYKLGYKKGYTSEIDMQERLDRA